MKSLVESITAMVLKPDHSKIEGAVGPSAMLRNHIHAFQDLMLEYLPWLFKAGEKIIICESPTLIYLQWDGIEFVRTSNNPPVICQEKQEAFTNDCCISFYICKDKETPSRYSVNLSIPMICNTGETDPWGLKDISARNYLLGGYTLNGKGMPRYPVSIEDDRRPIGQIGKKMTTATSSQFSFYVGKDLIRSYHKGQIPQYFKISLDAYSGDLIISCNNNNIELRLPPINILILCAFLTNRSLETLRESLKAVEYKSSIDVNSIIDILINRAIEILGGKPISIYIENILSDDKANSVIVIHNLMSQYNLYIDNPSLSKGLMLETQVRRMLMSLYNPNYYPDRDSLIRKRYLCAAKYFEKAFSDKTHDIAMLKVNVYKDNNQSVDVQKIRKEVEKILATIITTINSDISTGTFNKRTGVWVHDGYTSKICSLSRVTSTAKKLQKDITKDLSFRYYQNSQFMFQCPCDVPEHGENVGLVNSTSVITYISTIFASQKEAILIELIKAVKLFLDQYEVTTSEYYIIVDDMLIGVTDTDTSYLLYKHLRHLKRHGKLVRKDISIVRDTYLNELRISMDSGRLVQPILVVNDGVLELSKIPENDIINLLKKKCNLEDFMNKYPDVLEIVDCDMVQVPSRRSSYLAISATEFYNITESERANIDFCCLSHWGYFGWNINHRVLCNFSEAIRNVFYCSLAKSAIHNKILSKNTFDNYHKSLYTFTPLFRNPVMTATGMDRLGHSQVIWVLVIPALNGINQEDGVIINRNAVDAGMLSSIQVSKYTVMVDKQSRTDNTNKVISHSNQDKINPISGLPFINSMIQRDDALVRNYLLITADPSSTGGLTHKDESEKYFEYNRARVHKVFIDPSKPGNVNLLLVSNCDLINGDKLSSLGAQKSTVVSIVDKTELPHTPDGISPGIIMSPTGICTRKTLSMITSISTFILAILRKSDPDTRMGSSIRVRMGPIEENFDWMSTIDKSANMFDKAKSVFDSWPGQKSKDLANSSFKMIHPFTNHVIPNVSFSPFDYFKSRHLVNCKKKNICNKGRISEETKQTTANRKSGGAAKFDEMSRNVTICYGAAYTLKELLSEPEDRRSSIHVCTRCGFISRYFDDGDENYYVCDICINKYNYSSTRPITITYAAKIFLEMGYARGYSIIVNFKEYSGPMTPYRL